MFITIKINWSTQELIYFSTRVYYILHQYCAMYYKANSEPVELTGFIILSNYSLKKAKIHLFLKWHRLC